jgi:hypothetical protein
MKQKLADQIINDDEFNSFDAKVDALLDLARELEDIAINALKSFKCTQKPQDYPDSHWSNRLTLLLSKNE